MAAGLCLLVAFTILLLRKAYFNLPIYELKRLAAKGDRFAKTVYPAISYPAFRGLLWLLLAIFSAAAVVLLNHKLPFWLGVSASVIWLWLAFSWIPNSRVSNVSRQLAQLMAPFFAWFLHWSYPLIKNLEKVQKRYPPRHTLVYENEDLRALLRYQATQTDNRITARQLEQISKAVAFDQAKVGDYAKPWKASFKLAENDLIGPKLLDELHRSGQNDFLVLKQQNSREVSGILSRNAVGLQSEGRVKNFMNSDVGYIAKDEPIENALIQFAHGDNRLLVVTTRGGTVSGSISLKDALAALLSFDIDKTEPKVIMESVADELKQVVTGQ